MRIKTFLFPKGNLYSLPFWKKKEKNFFKKKKELIQKKSYFQQDAT